VFSGNPDQTQVGNTTPPDTTILNLPTPHQQVTGFIPVTTMCSNAQTDSAGSNVEQAENGLVIQFMNELDGKSFDVDLGSSNSTVENTIINERKIYLTLNDVTDGRYTGRLCDKNHLSQCTTRSIARIKINIENGKLQANQAQVLFGSGAVWIFDRDEKECDQTMSPLVIDLAGSAIELTSITDGVRFDLNGDGVKERISGFKNSTTHLLALDDPSNNDHEIRIESGRELFGNYTLDEAGQTSANGFEALAKYDSNKDGKINSADDVFAKLLLWHDTNFDGRSEQSELKTLEQAGLAEIDLNYQFSIETDRYGNETRERSQAKMQDGSSRIMFDLWFRAFN
jgi:hypothetical protein